MDMRSSFRTHIILMCYSSSVDDLVVKRIDVCDLVTFTRLLDEFARSFDLCVAGNQSFPPDS
jgi:hypothetical protein